MRKIISTQKPDFQGTASQLENYTFEKDGLQLKTEYTQKDLK